MSWLKNAFAVKPEQERVYSEEENAVLDKLVKKVTDYRMEVPAIMFLESVKPLNFVASQVMVFFKPFVSAFFSTREYDLLINMLEDRDSIEVLLKKIEAFERNASKQGERAKDGS